MHYLDHAATTPVPAAVAAVMTEVLTQSYGNPSAQYALGRQARDLVERSRGTIARALACRPEQVVFTSCGTEGDNWAIRAALYQNRRVGKHIITTAAEHSAVLQCLKKLEQEGYAVTYLKPDGMGRIAPRQVEDALRADTALVSVMLVNNETGVRFPVEEIAALLKNRDTLLHTDAVQGFLKLPFTAQSLGADYITLSAHKIGGPKGTGALYTGGRTKTSSPCSTAAGRKPACAPAPNPPPRSPVLLRRWSCAWKRWRRRGGIWRRAGLTLWSGWARFRTCKPSGPGTRPISCPYPCPAIPARILSAS